MIWWKLGSFYGEKKKTNNKITHTERKFQQFRNISWLYSLGHDILNQQKNIEKPYVAPVP